MAFVAISQVAPLPSWLELAVMRADFLSDSLMRKASLVYSSVVLSAVVHQSFAYFYPNINKASCKNKAQGEYGLLILA